ncbi:LysE family translocator [Pelagibacterium xiamenense]|uniref:LysE family translocator n=1 Tax=Pelagibacterium xiamenense TaxID=2901140 RepID=UPI001E35438C|nr:LysE family translocator [Pelagibacterium xiamenense]MCD7060043.1 LysE family translocator [Pelagibacterium xiamenense]
MFLLDFLPYAVALAIAAAIPGPGIAAAVGKALGSGFRPALWFLGGLVLGDLTYLSFAVLGLTAIAATYSGLFVVIKFAGAAYLVYLAISFWRAGIDPEKVSARKGSGFFASMLSGFSVTISNPKTIIFYMALLPTVVDLEQVTPADFGWLVVISIAVLYVVLVPYIALAAKARNFLRNPRALKFLNRGAAGAMAGAAAFIVAKQ